MTQTATSPAILDVLEPLMNAVWPSLDVVELDGWVLRAAGAVTRRANSVWPQAVPAAWGSSSVLAALPEKVAQSREHRFEQLLRQTEKWYAERHQLAQFQMTNRPENVELDRFLAGQGYSLLSGTLIMTMSNASAITQNAHNSGAVGTVETMDQALVPLAGGVTLEVAHTPTAQWLELWCTIEGTASLSERDRARELVQSVPSLYVSAVDRNGTVVGTGRVSVSSGWGGIYCMGVHPNHRRRGVARAIMDRLMACSFAHGANQVWLLVATANTAAQTLYGSVGFAEVGSYHYRRQPEA